MSFKQSQNTKKTHAYKPFTEEFMENQSETLSIFTNNLGERLLAW